MVPGRGDGGHHRWYVDARRDHRSRRPAHPRTGGRAKRLCLPPGAGRLMKFSPPARTRWWLVVVFAIGMAWVEAASVYYLRVMIDRLDPYQANPLPMRGVLEPVELVREAATLLMVLTI